MCPSALVRSCESCFWTQRFCLLPWPRWSCFNLGILPIANLFTNHTKVCRVDSRELRLSPLMVLAGVAYRAMPCDAASKFLLRHGAGLHTGLIIGGVSKSLRLRMTNIANIFNYHQISSNIKHESVKICQSSQLCVDHLITSRTSRDNSKTQTSRAALAIFHAAAPAPWKSDIVWWFTG